MRAIGPSFFSGVALIAALTMIMLVVVLARPTSPAGRIESKAQIATTRHVATTQEVHP